MIIVGTRTAYYISGETKYRLIAIFGTGIIVYVSRYKKDDRALAPPVVKAARHRLFLLLSPFVPTIIDLPSAEIVSPLLGPTPGIIDTTWRVRYIRQGNRAQHPSASEYLTWRIHTPARESRDKYYVSIVKNSTI